MRTTPTNDTGDYLFNLLPIGTYTVKVELQGFSTRQSERGVRNGRVWQHHDDGEHVPRQMQFAVKLLF